MRRAPFLVAALLLAVVAASFPWSIHAQPRPGIERLYVLNCGGGVAGDISRWSPGATEAKSMEFVDNCYLIKHAQGWMIWAPAPRPRRGAPSRQGGVWGAPGAPHAG